MKRSLLVLLLFPLLFFLSSCLVRNKPRSMRSYYNVYAAEKFGYITDDMISKGESLKKDYPDEDFVYTNVLVKYTFDVNEKKLLGTTKKKEKKSKKRNKKKNKRSSDDDEDQEEDENEDKDREAGRRNVDDNDKENEELYDNGIKVLEENKARVVSLNDNQYYENAIFYSGPEKVSRILYYYGDKPSTLGLSVDYTRSYEQNGIFHSDVKMKPFSVPMHVIGNSLDFKYYRQIDDYKYLTTVYMTEEYPCLQKTVSFEVPEGLDIEIREYNFEGYEIKRTEGDAPKDWQDAADEKSFDYYNEKQAEDINFSKTKGTTKIINYTITKSPGYRGESFSYGPTHSIPHLLVLCKSYTNGTDSTSLMASSNDLYKWYSTLAGKMKNKPENIKKIAEKLIAGKKTDQEKISAIFYWVQDNIRYIAFEDGLAAFKPDECQNVFDKRYGDCKGMANLTKEMLKSVGFDARLTWIGTNRIAYPGDLPSISTANHMICAVYLDTSKAPFFLDATEQFVSYGDYAERIQGKKVIIENGEKYNLETIPSFGYEHNKLEKTEQFIISGNNISGTVKEEYNGESKTNVIRSYNNVRLDQRERALRTYLNNNDFNITISDIKHTDFSERDKPFEINYVVEVKNHIITDGNRVLVNIEWERGFDNFYIDTARLTNFSFSHKNYQIKKSTLTIPKGYTVVSLPAPVNIVNEYFIYRLSYTQSGNTITYTKEIILPKGFLHRKEIKAWNEANAQLTNFYDNYIVLKK